MPDDMGMILPEVVTQGALGMWIGMLITWLRSKDFMGQAKNSHTIKFLTLLFSYALAFVTTIGVHFTFEGDVFVGGQMVIQWPSLHHMLEAGAMFAANLAGQKRWANDHKSMSIANHFYKLVGRPGVEEAITALLRQAAPPDAPEVVRAKKLEALRKREEELVAERKALEESLDE